jgi:hypothetical protein
LSFSSKNTNSRLSLDSYFKCFSSTANKYLLLYSILFYKLRLQVLSTKKLLMSSEYGRVVLVWLQWNYFGF